MLQTKRLYWIDAEIRAGRFPNATRVSEEFGVSERTAFEDRNRLLNDLNAPLATDRRRGGWHYTDTTYMLPFLALSGREANALRRSLLAAQEYCSPQDAEPVRLLAARLEAFTPTSEAAARERVRGSIRLTGPMSSELLTACERAVTHRQKMRLLYYSARRDEMNERTVQPYDLLHWRGEPHLIAYCEMRRDIRQFFLGRVRQWELLPDEMVFVRDPGFDIDVYLARGLNAQHGEDLVMVRLRFSPYQARWIRERQYHASQEIEEQKDGGLILTLRVAGTEEIRRWILGYGAEVETLEPEELRLQIAGEAKKTSENLFFASRVKPHCSLACHN